MAYRLLDHEIDKWHTNLIHKAIFLKAQKVESLDSLISLIRRVFKYGINLRFKIYISKNCYTLAIVKVCAFVSILFRSVFSSFVLILHILDAPQLCQVK